MSRKSTPAILPMPAPEAAPVRWSTVRSLSWFAAAFGVSARTMARYFANGTVAHRKRSPKSYQVALHEIPAKWLAYCGGIAAQVDTSGQKRTQSRQAKAG